MVEKKDHKDKQIGEASKKPINVYQVSCIYSSTVKKKITDHKIVR